MTSGSVLPQMVFFALPLLIGNIFQLLYNTVDTLVVGNFVSTQALAAVGSTSVIINIIVFFFNGLSVGASVVIGQRYGAGDFKKLHTAVETTIFVTLLASALFTVIGVLLVRPMLVFMSTPADVVPEATVYLRIYFAGISGLLIYNMGSGILRAVGEYPEYRAGSLLRNRPSSGNCRCSLCDDPVSVYISGSGTGAADEDGGYL